MSTASSTWAAVDAILLDHLPTCPRCGDLSDAGSERCQSCGRLLLGQNVKPKLTLAQVADGLREIGEPEKSEMAKYWLSRFSDDQVAEFVSGVVR